MQLCIYLHFSWVGVWRWSGTKTSQFRQLRSIPSHTAGGLSGVNSSGLARWMALDAQGFSFDEKKRCFSDLSEESLPTQIRCVNPQLPHPKKTCLFPWNAGCLNLFLHFSGLSHLHHHKVTPSPPMALIGPKTAKWQNVYSPISDSEKSTLHIFNTIYNIHNIWKKKRDPFEKKRLLNQWLTSFGSSAFVSNSKTNRKFLRILNRFLFPAARMCLWWWRYFAPLALPSPFTPIPSSAFQLNFQGWGSPPAYLPRTLAYNKSAAQINRLRSVSATAKQSLYFHCKASVVNSTFGCTVSPIFYPTHVGKWIDWYVAFRLSFAFWLYVLPCCTQV